MKKIKLFIFIMFFAIVLASCQNQTAPTFASKQEELGYQTAFGLTMFNSNVDVSARKLNNGFNTSDSISEELLQKINGYLEKIENFLSGDSPVTIVSQESDLEGYQTKLVVSTKDLLGNVTDYMIYLNELLDAETDEEETNEEEEKEFSITGILISDGVNYTVTGSKEIENDESELQLKIQYSEDKYVLIEQEIEDDESEYNYSYYEGGKIVNQIKLDYDLEDKEQQIKVVENDTVYSYKRVEEDNKTLIHVTVKTKDETFKFKVKSYVDSETNNIVYEYHVVGNDKIFNVPKGKSEKKEG